MKEGFGVCALNPSFAWPIFAELGTIQVLSYNFWTILDKHFFYAVLSVSLLFPF